MAKEIEFKVKLSVDGKEQLVTATTDIGKFAKGMAKAQTDANRFRDTMLKFNQIGQAFQNAITGLQQFAGVIHGYTEAYKVQEQAETQLATAMRNTMGVREEDIQSIKDLCSEQQRLGVIGDEVQLAGAKQLATFVKQRDSMAALIPVMNDMIAKQQGLDATAEGAQSTAMMLGKAMNGTTTTLERAGYFLSDAQKQILKFGTEEQKVAVLSAVIEEKVGGMNEQLAQTDSGKAKQMANSIGDLKEKVGSLFMAYEPIIGATAELGMALMGVGTICSSVGAMYTALRQALVLLTQTTLVQNAAQVICRSNVLRTAIAHLLFAVNAKKAAMAMNVMANATRSAATAAVAAKVAIRGLLAATGIGIAVTVLCTIIGKLADKMDDAAESADGVISEAEKAKQAEESVRNEVTQSTAQYNNYISKLKVLTEAKKAAKDVSKDEQKIVGELNNTYGETMGYFSNVYDWYTALTANSKAYTEQMIIEARARMIANQIAENQQKQHDILYNKDGTLKRYSKDRTVQYEWLDPDGRVYKCTPRVIEGDVTKKRRELAGLRNEEKGLKNELDDLNSRRPKMGVVGSPTPPKGGSGRHGGHGGGGHGHSGGSSDTTKKLIKDAKTLADLQNNLEYYDQELQKVNKNDTEQIKALSEKKKAVQDEIDAFNKAAQAEEAMPDELKTIEDYDKKLAALNDKRYTASDDQLANIDAEIEATEKAKKAFEEASIAAMKDDEIDTYDKLNKKLSYYTDLLQGATAEERAQIQEAINGLEKLREKWDAALEDMNKPGAIDTLNNVEELEQAVAYYEAKQRKASTNEIAGIQATLDALKKKRDAMQAIADVATIQAQADSITGAGKGAGKMLQNIGADQLADTAKQLRDLLNNGDIVGDQRKQIEELIKLYDRWAASASLGFDTIKDGWGGIQGIGDGINSMTEALDGNKSAWETITSVVNAAIQIYEGFSKIVEIVNLIMTAFGIAKTKTATGAAAATVANTAEAESNVALTATSKTAEAAVLDLAAAQIFAAHAMFPFVGVGLATGQISSMFGAMAGFHAASMGLAAFAKGGIVSGPTLALVGEYGGARNNPEVIAPLDKLRTMIGGHSTAGTVHFKIEGRNLVGVLANETRVGNKSGKRTNIKL